MYLKLIVTNKHINVVLEYIATQSKLFNDYK